MVNYLDKDNKIAYKFKNYYDPNHNKIKVIHSDGMEELLKYDYKNKLIKYEVKDIDNEDNNYHEIYVRDYDNNMVKKIKSDGRFILTFYNMIMQPISESDSFGNTTLYAYDELYRCINIKDNKNNIEEFKYDRMGNLVYHRKEPIIFEEWWVYDKLNQLIEYRNSNDIDIFYTYKNGLKDKEYNSFTDNTIQFRYNNDHKLIYSIDSKGKEDSYAYDNKGNLVKHEDEYYIKEYYYDKNNLLTEYIRKVK